MPDRYGDPRDDTVDLDRPTAPPRHDDNPAHLTAHAIVECGLCDDHGYRGLHVCDHVDRTDTTARGLAAVRAALTKTTGAVDA